MPLHKNDKMMGRKLTLQGFKKKLDLLWGQVILARDNYTCQRCGKKLNRLDPHHIWGKATLALRYSLLNGMTLCTTCHRWGDGAHGASSHSFDWQGLYIRFLESEEMYWEIRRLKDKQKAYPTMESLRKLEHHLRGILELNGSLEDRRP